METDMNTWAAGMLYGWFALVYVIFVASGGLPSELDPRRRPPARVLFDRLGFFVAIFAVPAIVLVFAWGRNPAELMLTLGNPLAWLPLTILLSCLAAAAGYFSVKSRLDLQMYPQYLPARRTAASMFNEVGSWALYLWAYEFAFRGYLLAALLPLGIPAAIAVNTALYSFAHLPKSGKEATGALVLGAVLSLLTLAWGTMIPAFLIHLALALGNDGGAIRALRISTQEGHL